MNNRKIRLTAMVCCLAFLLCGCTQQLPQSDVSPELTLPPAAISYVAPIGDAALEYTADAVLYLPAFGADRLVSFVSPVSFSPIRPEAESLVRALLNHSGTDSASSLGGSVQLALYGANPVEVSNRVATVNLAASAFQLTRSRMYTVFQAITNTLTELDTVDYVNFLVVDRAIGLDTASTLPIGSMSRSLGEDVTAAYEQRLTRRVGVTENAAEKPLSVMGTLYFPLAGTPGILSEVRSLAFANQLKPEMIVTLLQELGKGPRSSEIRSPALPLLSDMLSTLPAVTYSDALGGDVIDLRFVFNLDEMLEAHDLTRANCMASICYTLTTFFPGTAGITVAIGEQPVETLMLTGEFTSSVLFTDRIQQRTNYAPLMYDLATLYFADEAGQKLVRSGRPVPYNQRQSPRYLLLELAKGPQSYDLVQGLQPIMPENGITDADILGMSLSNSVILINLAPSFQEVGQGMEEQPERMLAYAMVNTLCDHQRYQGVFFFQAGTPPEGFSGKIYWQSPFYPMGTAQ